MVGSLLDDILCFSFEQLLNHYTVRAPPRQPAESERLSAFLLFFSGKKGNADLPVNLRPARRLPPRTDEPKSPC
jgi:hypothetical protein